MYPNADGILFQEHKILEPGIGDARFRLKHQGWDCHMPPARHGEGRAASAGVAVGIRQDCISYTARPWR
eukprot:1747046-Pyramimonas_sp.AAC.1